MGIKEDPSSLGVGQFLKKITKADRARDPMFSEGLGVTSIKKAKDEESRGSSRISLLILVLGIENAEKKKERGIRGKRGKGKALKEERRAKVSSSW